MAFNRWFWWQKTQIRMLYNNNIINNLFIYTLIYYKTLLDCKSNTVDFKNDKNYIIRKVVSV